MITKRTPSAGRFPPRRSSAGRWRFCAAAPAGRRRLRPEDVAEDGAEDRNEQRSYERRPEPGNGQRCHGGNQIEHQRVYDQGKQPEAEDVHRQGEQQDDWADEGVRDPQDEGNDHGVREHGFGDLQSLNDQRRHVHGNGGEHPAEDESCDHAAGSSGMINQQSRYANTPGKTPVKMVVSAHPSRRSVGSRLKYAPSPPRPRQAARRAFTSPTTCPGRSATAAPTAVSASILAAAVPSLPEITAPACPMRFPGGAVRPAM